MSRYFDDLQLGSVELFCLAAENGSFTRAATEAGLTPAAVSRSIARMEQRLGVRLFVRTTRRMRLTEEGRAYYEQCQQALKQLVEAERQITGGQLIPSGRLRISAPTPYAHHRLLPLLPAFRQQYPDIHIDIHVSNRNIDFAEEGFDLAIRGREPEDSNLIARRLEDAELVIVANPGYLRRAGTPQVPDDLTIHECIQFEIPSSGRKGGWTFSIKGRQVEMETSGTYTCQGDFLATVTLAKNGAGLMQAYRFSVQQELDSGMLKEVLAEYGGTTRPFMLIYPHARHLPLRVRVFIDYLLENLNI
ncbi:LysR family transcriptional regulator [Pectobacterium quasiaquaticum]|uniref:LysR family transcriptional regulator n=1 Tax=Pectobacterium quasiaquaticum TaxID=2774015 RepID=A0A9Q2EQ43_9GAMM|nr:LysR family transcriptional regulator [Pectobacterium quasiaquaticum]MBE5202378.1 LysR family transcriptional regulator [Pectobacterium quasiaquaticum]MBE5208619.1 LysR family transcriptional regulator [Pectobacterium quasiaquaticum]MBE5214159.1 LysR family transcriptional regulator [Pectobacterium quasiaquaticum]MBE5219964.1 LysR family transcriptional regulator [Pectobacterium quasiaquaticum]MBE5226359.1 LysR family transcriptional regulator [Pectobacterium quasiaquaticum]